MIFIVSLQRFLNKILSIMKDNITLSELELPQLRQMVLENSQRINKNETQINEMNMKISEQEQKDREREEWWEKARREEERARQAHNRDIQEIRELQKAFQRQLIEQSVSNDLALKKSRREFDKQMQESRELHNQTMAEIRETGKYIKETGDYIKETGDYIRETGDYIRETGDYIRETGNQIRDMVVEIRGITGHIMEGLISTTAEKLFQDAGFDLINKGKNLKRKLKARNLEMEVDVLLSNDETAVPIEVKSNCTKGDIDHFLEAMGKFRTLFPEYAGHEVIAGIAALNYERDAYEHAQQQGLLVIHVSSDYIFSIAPFDKQKLKRF